MTRRNWLASLAAPAVLSPQARRRSIVFVLVDDHRFDCAGALGHPWLQTPHLDRLARGGVVFRNAFVTTSLCSPSRASLLTGLYAHAHRVLDNFTPLDPKLPVFPAMLRAAGYRTGYVGKWHMGGASDEPRPGFDHWLSFFGQGQYENPELNRNGRREQAKGYMTDILAEEAVRFVRESAGRPFMLYLSHKATHYPFVPAARHRELYTNTPVPRPDSMNYRDEDYAQRPEWVRRRRYSRQGLDGMYDHAMPFDDVYRNYCRTLAAVDDSVGTLMAELERQRMLESTVFVYMGDNGLMWGEHGLIDKRAMYEPSIRVPMILHCPELARPRNETRMALNLDIAPTFLDAAGVRPAAPMHGRSLLRMDDAPWRNDFLYEYEWESDYPYTPTLTGLRTQRYSYCQTWGQWDLDELYDLERDPEQMRNLLGGVRLIRQRGRLTEQIPDAALRDQVHAFQDRMRQILVETGGDPKRSGRTPPGWKEAL
ncbi:MAG: sulfatase [Bryobacteraceae bacterium]